MATRRVFLQTFASAAAASALPQAARAQDVSAKISDEPIPGFPAGGFPRGSTRLNFNENPLGPSPKVLETLSANGFVEAHRYNYNRPGHRCDRQTSRCAVQERPHRVRLFPRDPGAHDLAEPVAVERFETEPRFDLLAHGFGPRLGAEESDPQLEACEVDARFLECRST